MWNQALVSKFFNISISIDDKDTDLSLFNGFALLNKDFDSAVICRLHTVTTNWDNIVCVLCFGNFLNPDLIGRFGFKEVSCTCRCRIIVKVELQHASSLLLGLDIKNSVIFDVQYGIYRCFAEGIKSTVLANHSHLIYWRILTCYAEQKVRRNM